MKVDEITYQNLIMLLLQFLDEENYRETLHSLEQESKIFFNVDYFGECIINGKWDQAEKYLAAFTELDDNLYSRKLFFELRKQKYFEVLERNDDPEAVNILWKDLNMFSVSQENDLAKLSSSDSIRVNVQLSVRIDTPSTRVELHNDLKVLLKLNPKLQHKLVFPRLEKSGLLSLIKLICRNPESKTRSVKEELIYLILQFLEEEKFNETAHLLEQESKIFNLDYFKQHVINGEWDKAYKYLSAFTNMDNDECLMNIFLEMQKQKDLEVLDRTNFLQDLENIVEKNATCRDKLKFPNMDKSRLLTIIKQSMEWWVPRYAHVRPRNETISLESIPKVSNLFHVESPIISEYHDQVVPLDQSGYESRELTCSATDKSTICELTEINEPSECYTLVLPDDSLAERVARLIYSYSGDSIVALTDDATHKLRMWPNYQHSSGKANENAQSWVYQLSNGLTMNNEIGKLPCNPCLALNGPYLLSASGGKISVFNLDTFEKLTTFAETTSSTYFIFLNQSTLAFGFHDSSILIHCFVTKMNIAKLEGHQRQITCLAFSQELNVLVSSGADALLCVWNANGWHKQSSKFLRSLCTGQLPDPPVVKYIQFHQDQIHLLVVNERQIDIYEAPLLDHQIQWIIRDSDAPITSATYSCNGESIYVCCRAGCIKVLVSTTLQVKYRINLSISAQTTACVQVYPLVIAAHPTHPNQIAVGLSNGRVYVLEPQHSGGWRATLLEDDQGLKHQQH
ncbi:hypothetical protein SLEP1_g1709 [Rubroshorea leprosula]|uniref:CTLH domain-containing protein n=3 Tax=Rubroshorea leprosula TaxID=152421 RepID=A0AAV5HNE6_9ROSI|nr:hypothetical protein SLEP1_g1709 [Rubroshorea leprosula]